MKKVLILIITMNIIMNGFIRCAAEEAEDPLPNAAAYILVENSSGQVLSELNADERLSPASLTKIMLLILIAEEVNADRLSLDDTAVASAYASSMDGSVIWLNPGEAMSVGDMVKSVVISSANDAAVALAEHIAGSEEGFVKLMNQKAYVLGMTDTNFTNVVGYDRPEHYTTARDAAIMSRALMREENYAIFAEYMLTRLCSVRTGTDRETQLLNTNKLITYYKGIEGIKTGTTDNAGYCLSAAASQGEMRLISIVMGCKDEDDRVNLSESLLNYGFSNYELYSGIGSELPPFENIPVSGGVQREVKLMQIHPGSIVIPKGRSGDIVYEIYLPDRVTAPIAFRRPIGTITATLDREIMYEGYITAAHTVQELTFLKILIFLVRNFFNI